MLAISSFPEAEFVLDPLPWNAKERVAGSTNLRHFHVFLLQALLPPPLATRLFMLWVKSFFVSSALKG